MIQFKIQNSIARPCGLVGMFSGIGFVMGRYKHLGLVDENSVDSCAQHEIHRGGRGNWRFCLARCLVVCRNGRRCGAGQVAHGARLSIQEDHILLFFGRHGDRRTRRSKYFDKGKEKTPDVGKLLNMAMHWGHQGFRHLQTSPSILFLVVGLQCAKR